MALFYQGQSTFQMIGTKVAARASITQTDPTFVITTSTLTASYAGNVSSGISIGGASQANFNVYYTAGTNVTSLNLKFEFSGDEAQFQAPVNWFQETSESVGAGTTTEYLQVRSFTNNGSIVNSTTYKFHITMPIADRFIRVSAQENLSSGTTFGSVYVEMVLSGK